MKQIKPEEWENWVQQHATYALIDVREQWEHEAFNIGGLHIPLGEIISRKEEIEKQELVVIYCEKGIRSVIAIQRLEALGFDNLINLQGGMSAWRKQLPH